MSVFTYAGRPVGQVNTRAWQSALQRAGIVDFRWHDLRHTWASWLIRNGTPPLIYRNWEVRRYAHLAPAQMAGHASVISALLHDTNAVQDESAPE